MSANWTATTGWAPWMRCRVTRCVRPVVGDHDVAEAQVQRGDGADEVAHDWSSRVVDGADGCGRWRELRRPVAGADAGRSVRLAARRPCGSGRFRRRRPRRGRRGSSRCARRGWSSRRRPGAGIRRRRSPAGPCPLGPPQRRADPAERDGDQVVAGVVGAAGDPHGSSFGCFCCAGRCFVDWCWLVVCTVSSWVGCWGPPFFRRPDHGCDRGPGQGAVGAAAGRCWSGRVDARRSAAGEADSPGRIGTGRGRRSPWPRPVPSDPWSGRRKRAGSPGWGYPNSQALRACPSGSSGRAADLGEDARSARRPWSRLLLGFGHRTRDVRSLASALMAAPAARRRRSGASDRSGDGADGDEHARGPHRAWRPSDVALIARGRRRRGRRRRLVAGRAGGERAHRPRRGRSGPRWPASTRCCVTARTRPRRGARRCPDRPAYWSITVGTVAALVVTIRRGRRRSSAARTRTRRQVQELAPGPGWRHPADITRTVGRNALLAQRVRAAPDARPAGGRRRRSGVAVGHRPRRRRVDTSVRDSVVLLGPSGAGKGVYVVNNRVLDAPGAGRRHLHPPRRPRRSP